MAGKSSTVCPWEMVQAVELLPGDPLPAAPCMWQHSTAWQPTCPTTVSLAWVDCALDKPWTGLGKSSWWLLSSVLVLTLAESRRTLKWQVFVQSACLSFMFASSSRRILSALMHHCSLFRNIGLAFACPSVGLWKGWASFISFCMCPHHPSNPPAPHLPVWSGY